jgi:hypothetical protein
MPRTPSGGGTLLTPSLAVESSLWYNRVFKKDYAVALNLACAGIDDPDGVRSRAL